VILALVCGLTFWLNFWRSADSIDSISIEGNKFGSRASFAKWIHQSLRLLGRILGEGGRTGEWLESFTACAEEFDIEESRCLERGRFAAAESFG